MNARTVLAPSAPESFVGFRGRACRFREGKKCFTNPNGLLLFAPARFYPRYTYEHIYIYVYNTIAGHMIFGFGDRVVVSARRRRR